MLLWLLTSTAAADSPTSQAVELNAGPVACRYQVEGELARAAVYGCAGSIHHSADPSLTRTAPVWSFRRATYRSASIGSRYRSHVILSVRINAVTNRPDVKRPRHCGQNALQCAGLAGADDARRPGRRRPAISPGFKPLDERPTPACGDSSSRPAPQVPVSGAPGARGPRSRPRTGHGGPSSTSWSSARRRLPRR